jgi:nitrogenase molybdenum-iron protein NifN
MSEAISNKQYVSARNTCKLCAPLGASMVFKGIEGCVPLIHGSQGCATYIRRYMISHFKEPVDIASSNFSEESTIYGGSKNFILGIDNIIKQYKPKVIGIASTCLSETIGEDIPGHIYNYLDNRAKDQLPFFIHSSTPSYCGSHAEGFHKTVLAVIKTLANKKESDKDLVIFPGMVTPADIRYIKEIVNDFNIRTVIFPDYSETLDNVYTSDYQLIPSGGTSLDDICAIGGAGSVIEFGNDLSVMSSGGWLEDNFKLLNYQMGLPIGINACDKFMNTISKISGKPVPEKYMAERGRLVDSYVDAHKYVFGKKALLYGDSDLVISLSTWLCEIGMEPVYILDADFETLREKAEEFKPDLMIGNSKGYYISKERKIPLVRLGFPIHDRFGASRINMIGYRGTQNLFDLVVNELIEYKQENSPVGYKYI